MKNRAIHSATRRHYKARLKLFASLAAIAGPALVTPALAQTDEIVVTAQLREQSLQEVPIAVQVVDDQQIRDLAADNIADIAAFIPGLNVSAGSPTQPRYSIRGVQTDDFGVGTDPRGRRLY